MSISERFKGLAVWQFNLVESVLLTWKKNGYNDMRSIMYDAKKHETTKSHLTAFRTWKTYGAGERIDCLISLARRIENLRPNEEIRSVTEAVLYF